jgi:hypothetical protein
MEVSFQIRAPASLPQVNIAPPPQCTLIGKGEGTSTNMDAVRRGKKPIPFGNKTSISGLRIIMDGHEFQMQRPDSIQLHEAACSYTPHSAPPHTLPGVCFDELSCVVS